MSSLILKIFYRLKFRKRRLKLRAWNSLMAGNNSLSALKIGQGFEEISLGIDKKNLEKLEPSLNSYAIEKNIIQRLCTFTLQESIYPNLTLKLAGLEQPATVCLPPTWRKKLQELGIPIKKSSSTLLWISRILQLYVAGVFRALKLLYWAWMTRVSVPDESYSVIFIPKSDMIGRDVSTNNYDFLSTFLVSPAHLKEECHTWVVLNSKPQVFPKNISISKYGLPSLPTILSRIIFSYQLFSRIISDFIFITMGEWWRAILQDERIIYCYMQGIKSDSFASSYVFTSANLLVRPLWTYQAEAKGSRIMLVFISTNFYTFTHSKNTDCPVNVGLRSMTWPTYGVWGQSQREYLVFAGHINAEYIEMGAVGSSDDLGKSIILPENTLVLFDVSPIRNIFLAERGILTHIISNPHKKPLRI